jgi:hypothetical protein
MGKVSVGLRGWRFDEAEVFDADGNWLPLGEMSEDDRQRLVRLRILLDMPCSACYLEHGENAEDDYNHPTCVYGEPLHEVLLCDEHEPDFYFWYLEDGGEQHRGTEAFQDEFQEWFAAGNRAPEWYDGPDHVDTDPESLPEPEAEEPDPEAFIPEGAEDVRVDLREGMDPEGIDAEDLDLDTEYPTGDE